MDLSALESILVAGMIRYRKALAKRLRTGGPTGEDIEMGDLSFPKALTELAKIFGVDPLPKGPIIGTPSPSPSVPLLTSL